MMNADSPKKPTFTSDALLLIQEISAELAHALDRLTDVADQAFGTYPEQASETTGCTVGPSGGLGRVMTGLAEIRNKFGELRAQITRLEDI